MGTAVRRLPLTGPSDDESRRPVVCGSRHAWDGARQCASRQVAARSGEGVVPGALGPNTVGLSNDGGAGGIPVSSAARPACDGVAHVTKLMAWAALAGAVIGLVFLGAEGIVSYESSYEPPRGITADDRQTLDEFDKAFWDGLSWWNRLALPWWSYPLIGAASAAVLAAPFAIAGVRVSRVRR